MTIDVPATRTPRGRLREARRQLLDAGDLDSGLIAPGLQASWRRSLEYGLAATAARPARRTPRARNWRARWNTGEPWCLMRGR